MISTLIALSVRHVQASIKLPANVRPMMMTGVLKNYELNCDGPPMPHNSMSHLLACMRSLHLYLQQKDNSRCILSAVHPSTVVYCICYTIGGVNPGSAAYNLGNMKPVQLESLFSKKIGCPFWKMKPSTTGLPCTESVLGFIFQNGQPIAKSDKTN